MIEIEDAVKYFGDCKTKYLRRFTEITPHKNEIKGWISRKPDRYLGSLLIDEVNGEHHEQFIQSMPKMKYFEGEKDMQTPFNGFAFEKLDGSCLIIYPLIKNNKIIELVPKTRGRAVADKFFQNLYGRIDKYPIEQFYKENDEILMFEMYGISNQHEIIHYQAGLDIALIGAFKNGFYTVEDLKIIADTYTFKMPDQLFEIKDGKLKITSEKYKLYFNDFKVDVQCFVAYDYIEKMQKLMEMLNKKFFEVNGRIASEGVVFNCLNAKNEQKYIKIKPRDIENKHRSEGGIPRSSITKEVLKYFDEYGSEVKEIYSRDPDHHTEFIHRMLSEDYPPEFIKNSSKRIERRFMQIWEAKEIPQSFHIIADGIFEEHKDKGISHCMREFALKYPMKKKDSSTIYNILKIKFSKEN